MNLTEYIAQGVLILDGAMGTQVQSLGLTDEDFGGTPFRMLTDIVTLSHPELVKEIHLSYLRAGAQALETNSFGSSPLRLSEYDFREIDLSRFPSENRTPDLRTLSYEEIAFLLSKKAAEVACEAREIYLKENAGSRKDIFVLGSVGPSNRVVSSTDANLKPATFDEIVANFYCQVRGLLEGGVDAVLFETQQDILETKAAILGAQKAIREGKRSIPILCNVSVDAFARMPIFNTDIHAALVAVQPLGIAAFGINCSIGPDLMAKTVQVLSRVSPVPVSVVPNAGLPVSEKGKTVFKFPPEQFATCLRDYVTELGVKIVGGCCGTTPEHIAALSELLAGCVPAHRNPDRRTYISGPQQAVLVDSSKGLFMIGERLNVRGSKKVREAVESGKEIDHGALEEVVHHQVHELGLNVIDVCMDSNVVDTTRTLKEVIYRQTTDFSGAMCLDSFSVEALIEAIKVYPGRPILNSISLEEVSPGVTKLDALLQATAMHGPMYIALVTGPEGPAASAEEKVRLARQIVEKVSAYGVSPDQLFIDVNIFPIGSESVEGMNFAVESLNALPEIKAIHPDLRTICGIGNLTNGLAQKPYMRTVLTSVWLDEARKQGLDAAIINPNHYVFVENLDPRDYELGRRVILEHDMEAFADLETIAQEKKGEVASRRSNYDDLPPEAAICEKIKDGFKQREHGTVEVSGHVYRYADRIVLQVAEIIQHHDPLTFINTYLMAAMNELGDRFARGEVSLPHLLKSADVMKQVMGFLEAYMRTSSGADIHEQISYKGTVVLGTVYQDVHSIGKDLAKTLLENYGYRVIDLGVMTPLQKFLDAAREYSAHAIGMSALLVQTSNHMITVSQMMEEQGLAHLPLLIGGAPVNLRHAAYVAMAGKNDPSHMRKNVFYCATAMDGVNVMNTLLSGQPTEPFLEENHARLLKHLERAEKKAAEEETLLRTLPRRVVAFDHHKLPPHPWVSYQTVKYSLKEFAPYIDRKTLFGLNWKFGGAGIRSRRGETESELNALLQEWIEHADHDNWIQPMGVWGIFPCFSEGDEVIILDPFDLKTELSRFQFTVVIGGERKDTVSGAQYFLPKGSETLDAVGLQIATSGPQVDHYINKFREEGDSESCLLLQGLSDRVAEDMADHMHRLMRAHIGVSPKQGIRWSPGYPAISNTLYNRRIFEILHADTLLGIEVTTAGEFSPTGTTAAIVCFHPDARYT